MISSPKSSHDDSLNSILSRIEQHLDTQGFKDIESLKLAFCKALQGKGQKYILSDTHDKIIDQFNRLFFDYAVKSKDIPMVKKYAKKLKASPTFADKIKINETLESVLLLQEKQQGIEQFQFNDENKIVLLFGPKQYWGIRAQILANPNCRIPYDDASSPLTRRIGQIIDDTLEDAKKYSSKKSAVVPGILNA